MISLFHSLQPIHQQIMPAIASKHIQVLTTSHHLCPQHYSLYPVSVETQLVSPLVGAPCSSFSELLTSSLTTLQWLFTTLRIKWPGPHHDPQALCDVPLSVNCCFLFSPPPLCPCFGSARSCFICDAFAFCCSSDISMSHLSSLRLLLK